VLPALRALKTTNSASDKPFNETTNGSYSSSTGAYGWKDLKKYQKVASSYKDSGPQSVRVDKICKMCIPFPILLIGEGDTCKYVHFRGG